MNTKQMAQDLALDLLNRSPCKVKVACIVSDKHGVIFSWGWNHPASNGFSIHAEEHAIRRANPKRLKGAIVTIAGQRLKSGNFVFSRPCEQICWPLLEKHGIFGVEYIVPSGDWRFEQILAPRRVR